MYDIYGTSCQATISKIGQKAKLFKEKNDKL